MSEAAAILETAPAAPRKPPRRKRWHVDHFRTDDDEHAALAALAQAAGMSVDAFCRWKTLGDPGPRSKRAAPTEQDRVTADHAAAVKRVGVNVNQGIRALNEIALKAPETRSRDRLAEEVAATRELLVAMQRALDEALATDRAALGR